MSLYLRRGHTHGVLAMAVLPVVLAGVVMAVDRLWRRRRDPAAPPARFGAVLGLAYLATLTHPALDWMNTYGVRLLMPFDGAWFYGDALFIVDPWMWLMMGAAVVFARSSGRLSAAGWIALAAAASALVTITDFVPWPARVVWFVGVAAILGLRLRGWSPGAVRRAARVCVGALLVYLGAMIAASRTARDQGADWLRAQGVTVTDAMASPAPTNPFAHDVLAVTPAGYRFLRVDWLADPPVAESHDPVEGDVRNPIIDAARAAPKVRGMVNWLRYPSYDVDALPDGWRVTLFDMRYARMGTGIGIGTVELDAALKPR